MTKTLNKCFLSVAKTDQLNASVEKKRVLIIKIYANKTQNHQHGQKTCSLIIGFADQNVICINQNEIFTYQNEIFTYQNEIFTDQNEIFPDQNEICNNQNEICTD